MTTWPKVLPPLTAEQQAISDDFMHYWHEVLPRRFSMADRFGHQFVARTAPAGFTSTLEIGAGAGEHLNYEVLTAEQARHYHALDIRDNMLATLAKQHPHVQTLLGDCQQRLPFPDESFDRIIAIHVLEHLPNLPAAVAEMRRLSKPNGMLQVVLPCEGSFAYTLARRLSAQRIFERRYRQPYDWFIKREHLNLPAEVLAEMSPYFRAGRKVFFPLPVPALWCNIFVGVLLRPVTAPAREPEPRPGSGNSFR